MRTILVSAILTAVACSSADRRADQVRTGVAGRVTALAPTIWACPLENWRFGRDDGCDPIATGTAVVIQRRGVRPEYPHGPFALIDYRLGDTSKTQWVIDNTVTPVGENDPTVEDILRSVVRPSGQPAVVLSCREVAKALGEPVTWVLRLDLVNKTAEMLVHVPADSVASGVPPGNRRGILYSTDRQYDVDIPMDEGGADSEQWFRAAFSFEIDRYTGAGKAFVGGKTAEAQPRVVQCEVISEAPRF